MKQTLNKRSMKNENPINELKREAQAIANFIKDELQISEEPLIGIVLGTGFGDKLKFDDNKFLSRKLINTSLEFESLIPTEGHEKTYKYGSINGVKVLALSGRVHMNENPTDPKSIVRMVRLQIQIMLELGVKKLILTCSAGALNPSFVPGNLIVIDSLVTVFAPQMPLFGGEFTSPEDTLSKSLIELAIETPYNAPIKSNSNSSQPEMNFEPEVSLKLPRGSYAMVRGPFFEGRKHDKGILRNNGADCVGMSILPECCIASLYSEVEVLALAFISNDAEGKHSHEENLAKAKECSSALSAYLNQLLRKINEKSKVSDVQQV